MEFRAAKPQAAETKPIENYDFFHLIPAAVRAALKDPKSRTAAPYSAESCWRIIESLSR